MHAVVGELRTDVSVFIADRAVHVNIKNIAAVCQCRYRGVAFHDIRVIEYTAALCVLLGHMHHAFDIDDRIRLKLAHNLEQFLILVIIFDRGRHAKLINADADVDLAVLFCPEYIQQFFTGRLSVRRVERHFQIENLENRESVFGEECCFAAHVAIGIQAVGSGVADEQRVRKIGVINLLQLVIGAVRREDSFCLRRKNSPLRSQKPLVHIAVVFGLHYRIVDTVRNCKIGSRVRGVILRLRCGLCLLCDAFLRLFPRGRSHFLLCRRRGRLLCVLPAENRFHIFGRSGGMLPSKKRVSRCHTVMESLEDKRELRLFFKIVIILRIGRCPSHGSDDRKYQDAKQQHEGKRRLFDKVPHLLYFTFQMAEPFPFQ